jgi:hypothetical protein
MPIAYSCPHCGKQFSVAEQYAGMTGPCAACGKPISIPGTPHYAAVPKSGGGGGGMAVVVVVLVLLLLVVPGVLIALLLPAVQAAREAARRMQASNHLKQLALAMQNYHDVYNSLPPAVVTDASGKPLYSGRVLLLPFMEQKPLYDLFDKSQAWDSPANFRLSQMDIKVFRDPSAPSKPGETDFLFVTGAGTALESRPRSRFADILDGTSNTLFMVEVRGSGVNWAQPQDLDISQPMALPPGSHPGGNLAVFYDGHTSLIPKSTPPGTIHALATRGGGEVVAAP